MTADDDTINALAQTLRAADQRWWWSAEPEAPHTARYRCMAAAALSSGPDFVGAVAEIRALAEHWRKTAEHLRHDPNIATAFARCAEQAIAALDKAGCS